MKLVPLKFLRLHPDANRVPRMPPEQDAEFLADIAERGVRVPIEIIDGRVIVDGRSRYLAAKRLGIKRVAVIRAPLNGDDPVIYMLRAATKRRHLTDDQRACLAREEMEILSRIATRERARLGGLNGGRGRTKTSDSLPITAVGKQSRTKTSRGTVAVAYRVSERRIRAA
ncbi:MAG: ParB N-terminal domain-containing protein, partial [Planctomycetia bacterium]|nr:ParB N-terminal domain-containing protein [Planctomycetia bacterium]